MQKFLIIQTAFIGDVILCTPVLSELRRLYPSSQIDIVVRKGNESLLKNHDDVDNIIVWNKKDGKYRSLIKVINKLRKTRYDEIINLQRFHSAGLICMFSKAKQKIGFIKNKFPFIYAKRVPHNIGDGTHEVTRNLATIAHHEGSKTLVKPSLYPTQNDFDQVALLVEDTPYFCLAPASVWETKKLPTPKWIELIEGLLPKGIIYLIGGPDDHELCEEIRIAVRDKKVINLCGELTLLQSAALMREAKMNYVNDSGPMHLASSVNAPTVAFFCSTVPRFGFGPLSDNSKVVEIKEDLSCRPCGLHGYHSCPEGHFKCGKDIIIKPLT